MKRSRFTQEQITFALSDQPHADLVVHQHLHAIGAPVCEAIGVMRARDASSARLFNLNQIASAITGAVHTCSEWSPQAKPTHCVGPRKVIGTAPAKCKLRLNLRHSAQLDSDTE